MNWLLRIGKVFFITGLLFLVGCDGNNICNMTPNVITQNQSNIYTLTVAVRGLNNGIVRKNIKPYVVVNGEKHEMKKHPDGNNMFVYDYHFNGIGTIPYYFEVVYVGTRNGIPREKIAKSDLFSTAVTDKYIFALNANRGPVGATVNIVGYGLTRADKVRFGGRTLSANWLSSGAIEFVVPSVECDSEYEVYLLTNRKELLAGTFFVDESVLHCSTDFIRLANGESQRLVFMIDHPAQEDGVEVEITTDIPDNIVMPEVHFMPGERTVSVNITGGEDAAKGTLFVRAKGYSSLEIPLEIGDVDAETVSSDFQSAPEESDDVVVL
ncbi:MAG: hypothetical protein LBR92_03070 [Puniceicoccales bacterium]|jgi:hypothetical protein|nr:hypothetical protein [Puniceicoccales bacterium]